MGSLPFVLSLVVVLHLCSAEGSSEVGALMALKRALDPQGRALASWAPMAEPCGGGFEGWRATRAEGGEIPREIGTLAELTDLYLNVNNLSGGIPVEFGNLGSLQVLQLCYNQLTGSIPTQLGLLKKLNVLALQSNRLNGAIPATLGDLSQLIRLDLSFNHLFGSIPTKLAQLPELVYLDLRNNSLSGNVPSDLKRLQEGFQYENNTDLCGTGFNSLRTCTSADLLNPTRPEPFSAGVAPHAIPQSVNSAGRCDTNHCSHSLKSSSVAAISSVSIIALLGFIFGLIAFSRYRSRKQKRGSAPIISTNNSCRRSASSLINLDYSNGWDPLADGKSALGFSEEVSTSFRFNLEEVEFATQYFSEVNLLVKKSNSLAIYKGILRDGSAVVVKRISKTSCKSEEADFLHGLKIITSLKHENIVKLRGICCSRGRGECFLVYDFVCNGSLLQYLDVNGEENNLVLEWATRVSIIKGIAKGIQYLHSETLNKPSLIHQNISAEKILLDQNFKPLISSSGLHNLLADDVIFATLKASAAMGYLAPEYGTVGRFTEKSDVYAFGIIIFQMISGKRMTAELRLLAESGKLEDLIDGNLKGEYSKEEAAKLGRIALVCTSEDPNRRPTMEALLQEFGDI
uniref:Protein kinase domain-containing protein n=1 Tax=Ananas comosus var. bracteatus TaxID=296719 RepID=A0A6V7QKB6_ANACO|nr:unnamed protein product [Ananas comosus var. bracteatus]